MKYLLLLAVILTIIAGHPPVTHSASQDKKVQVEVLYMNHGPLQKTLQQLRGLFEKFAGKIDITWYDNDSEEGRIFKRKNNINTHIPLKIWLDNEYEQTIAGKTIAFSGFPTGAGPYFAQGKWNFADLEQALNNSTTKN